MRNMCAPETAVYYSQVVKRFLAQDSTGERSVHQSNSACQSGSSVAQKQTDMAAMGLMILRQALIASRSASATWQSEVLCRCRGSRARCGRSCRQARPCWRAKLPCWRTSFPCSSAPHCGLQVRPPGPRLTDIIGTAVTRWQYVAASFLRGKSA